MDELQKERLQLLGRQQDALGRENKRLVSVDSLKAGQSEEQLSFPTARTVVMMSMADVLLMRQQSISDARVAGCD